MRADCFAEGWLEIEQRWPEMQSQRQSYYILLGDLLDDEAWRKGVRSVLLTNSFRPRPADFFKTVFEEEFSLVMEMARLWVNEGKHGSWSSMIDRLGLASRVAIRDFMGGFPAVCVSCVEDEIGMRRKWIDAMERVVVHHGQRLGGHLFLPKPLETPMPVPLLKAVQ